MTGPNFSNFNDFFHFFITFEHFGALVDILGSFLRGAGRRRQRDRPELFKFLFTWGGQILPLAIKNAQVM